MTLVRVLSATEPWAEYQLDDGTLLRFRLTACNFRRTGKTTEQGDPEYSFTHAMQIETHARPVAAEVRQLRAVAEECDYCFKPRPCECDIERAKWAGHPIGPADTAPSPYTAPAEDCG